jgi:alpha-galactosidase
MKMYTSIACLTVCTALSIQAATLSLEDMDLRTMSSGWGKARKNLSVTEKPISIGSQKFAKGVGTHAQSEYWLALDGKVKSFSARVGVDDAAAKPAASIEFILIGDDKEIWRSGICKLGEAPKACQVNLAGIRSLALQVSDTGDGVNYDHADWVEAVFTYDGQPPKPGAPEAPPEEFVQLTPPAPATPRINGPKVYGVRPGSPFLYRIPCTGERPITFSAKQLPSGLSLDEKTGIITGKLNQAGSFPVTLIARNARGEATRPFRIECGNTLALTPPMGWNSWYIHYHRVSDKVMREAADQMIGTGMADYGYQYVNIDDCWMVKVDSTDSEIGGPVRDAQGRLLCNKRFPDMKAMTDYIHSKGLKAGTYISPGTATCAGYAGSYQHEGLDARTFSDWGFDFLKYDWCSYGKIAPDKTLPSLRKPYQLMWDELQKLDRDFVFNLCQYGMGEVWKWGGEVGHCWRTTGDLGLDRGGRLPGFYRIGLSNAKHHEYAKPGAWNDPDYILIGWVGDAHRLGEGTKTTLSPNEQYSYMSLWSLMAAPLIFSGDMAKLDAFTLNILCNYEVIAVNQDPLGKQARIVKQTMNELVMVKELEDGSRAIGLFNLGFAPHKLTASWSELGLGDRQQVRDLWRQKNIGEFSKSFEVEVPRHGVMMLQVKPMP